MDIVLKTILYSYPSYSALIKELETLAENKAVYSYKNCSKTLEQMEEIIQINQQIRKIVELQDVVNRLIGELNEKEKRFLEYKYFKRGIPEECYHNYRTYYRVQKRILEKLIDFMLLNGYNSAWLKLNYFDLYFIKMKYNRLKKLKDKGTLSNSASEWAA